LSDCIPDAESMLSTAGEPPSGFSFTIGNGIACRDSSMIMVAPTLIRSIYSYLRLSAGLARAAPRILKQTVARAITTAAAPAATKIHAARPVL
jgi:hypothetical protein